MLKRYYFGWKIIVKKETGEQFKMVTLAKPDESWHGYEVRNKFVSLDFKIDPSLKPGALVGVEYDERGNVEDLQVLNG